MNKFTVDGRYGSMLAYYNIPIDEVLKKADLPGDVFAHQTVTMSEDDYYRFMGVVGEYVTDPEMPVRIATGAEIESFSPPIFASYCSKNGRVCIDRLARYKKLIGPMRFDVEETKRSIIVRLVGSDESKIIPPFLAETEFAFLVGIIRKATREDIHPLRVEMMSQVTGTAFSDFLGTAVGTGSVNMIEFSDDDLAKPFISYNEAMWSYFEPELTKRLSELEIDDSVSARVRSALAEMLAGGEAGIEDVADRLGMTKRTLQRKLTEENTTFQKQLNSIREELAIHYIRNTDMPTGDISYLLGYNEVNSFLRAFKIWTGMGIGEYKAKTSRD